MQYTLGACYAGRNASTRDKHGFNSEKNEHRVLDDELNRDEKPANIRGARIEAYGRG